MLYQALDLEHFHTPWCSGLSATKVQPDTGVNTRTLKAWYLRSTTTWRNLRSRDILEEMAFVREFWTFNGTESRRNIIRQDESTLRARALWMSMARTTLSRGIDLARDRSQSTTTSRLQDRISCAPRCEKSQKTVESPLHWCIRMLMTRSYKRKKISVKSKMSETPISTSQTARTARWR